MRIWPNLVLPICGAPRYRICGSISDRHTKFRPSVGQVLSSQAMMRRQDFVLRFCVLIINYPSGSTCMSLGLPSQLSSWSACQRRVSRASKLSLCNNSSRRVQPTGQLFHCFAAFSILISFHLSWELGTRAQALLELSVPSFSVLTPNAHLPPPTSLNSSLYNSLAGVFTIAQNAVAALPPPPSNGSGQPLSQGDGSAGDPASIGVAVLIANWTNLSGGDYAAAATAQIQYLFGPAVPKTPDGAISHRVSELQLWYAVL